MPHQLHPDATTLAAIEDWRTTDSRRLKFVVSQDGNTKDLTEDTLSWELRTRPYRSGGEVVIDDTDSAVTVRRDGTVDETAGEFRIDIDEGAVADEWGHFWQIVTVDPPGDSRQSWIGAVTLTE